MRSLQDSSDVFRRRGWVIGLVVALALGGALYHVSTRPPQYQAEASILVTPEGIAPTALSGTALSAVRYAYRESVLNDIIHLLESRTISERAAARVGDLSGTEIARRVTARNIPGTDFLIIRAADARPDRAALIANAVAQELGGFYVQMYQAGPTRARVFIDEQLRLAQDRRGAADQAMLEFQARTGAVALTDEVSRTEQRVLDLQAAYEGATLDETASQTRVAAIRSHLAAQNDAPLASLSIATNPVVAQIRDHLIGLELQLAGLRQAYTDEHPAVKVLLAKIAADRERLSAEAAKVLHDNSLGVSPAREQFVREMIDGEVDAAAARARAAGIRAILDKLQAGLTNVPGNALTLARLQRDARDSEQLVTRLAALQQEAVMRESQAVASGQNAIVLVDQAIAPTRPIMPPFPQTAAVAGLLGLCLGAGLALGVEGAEKRIVAWRRREVAWDVSGLIPIPATAAAGRLGHRILTVAHGMALVLFPAVLAALILGAVLTAGVVAAAYGAQVGTLLAHLSGIGQGLAQAVHTIQGLYVAQVSAMPVQVAHVGHALMHVVSALQ